MTNTNYEDINKYIKQVETIARVSTFSKPWCRKSDSLHCTISLYKCSVITFITIKDQPVTSGERTVTNDSPETETETSNKHSIFYFETSITDWESMCRVG